MRTKVIGFVVFTGISLAMLTGCGDTESHVPVSETWVEVIDVNGRQIPCIKWDPPAYGVAMSCDWSVQ